MLIGTLPGVFSTGEVTYLAWNLHRERIMEVSVDKQNICTCRQIFTKCPVWGEVIRRLRETKHGNLLADSPLEYQMKFYNSTNAYNGRPSLFNLKSESLLMKTLLLHGNSVIPRLLHYLNRRIAENNWRVFDALSEISEAKFIVDSSKGMSRFYHLANHRPGRVSLIFLVRSAFGIAASTKKRGGDPLTAAKGWVTSNVSRYQIINQMPEIPSLVVQYEDICSDPVTERKRIADFLGILCSEEELLINSRNYHLVAGNPMRYTENIKIRHDESWKNIFDYSTIRDIQVIIDKSPEFLQKYLNS